jgi:hypothetical protein
MWRFYALAMQILPSFQVWKGDFVNADAKSVLEPLSGDMPMAISVPALDVFDTLPTENCRIWPERFQILDDAARIESGEKFVVEFQIFWRRQ